MRLAGIPFGTSGPVQTLWNNHKELEAVGLSTRVLWDQANGQVREDASEQSQMLKIKKRFQSTVH